MTLILPISGSDRYNASRCMGRTPNGKKTNVNPAEFVPRQLMIYDRQPTLYKVGSYANRQFSPLPVTSLPTGHRAP